jgi:hypothetical protein
VKQSEEYAHPLRRVVIRAPDHDRARAVRATPGRAGKTPGDALEIGKHAVAPLHGNAERGCIDVRDIFRVVRV